MTTTTTMTKPSLPVHIELLADFSRPGGERRGGKGKVDGVRGDWAWKKPTPTLVFEEQDDEEKKYWKAFDVVEKRIMDKERGYGQGNSRTVRLKLL